MQRASLVRLASLVLVFGLLLGCGTTTGEGEQPSTGPDGRFTIQSASPIGGQIVGPALDRLYLIAHRGYSARYPENSLQAFTEALRAGFDGVELDLRRSSDGRAMVIHDAGLARSYSVGGLVAERTHSALLKLGLPDLNLALDALSQARMLQIELKDAGLEAELVEALHARELAQPGYLGRVRVLSFIPEYLREVKRLDPKLRCVLLSVLYPGQKAAFEFNGLSLHLTGATLATGDLERLRASGRELFIWAIENDAQARAALSLGANGLVSDHLPLVVEMVRVEGGDFVMGSDARFDGTSDEGPAHQRRVGDFLMSRFEVSQALYQGIMGVNPSTFTTVPLAGRHPVESVSWFDAVEFANALSRYEGLPPAYSHSGQEWRLDPASVGYRLPSEVEWEYAARGGSLNRDLPFAGSFLAEEVAWYRANSGEQTHPRGTLRPNELGLFDLSGNVLEWCEDWYQPYSAALEAGTQPLMLTEPTEPSEPLKAQPYNKVSRGGSWGFDREFSQVTFRTPYAPDRSYPVLGIRLVRSLP